MWCRLLSQIFIKNAKIALEHFLKCARAHVPTPSSWEHLRWWACGHIPNLSKIGQAVLELCQWTLFATPFTLHVPRATVIIQKSRGHLDSRRKGCSYPPKKTAHETDLRLQRYKLVKSVGWLCRVGWCRAMSGRSYWDFSTKQRRTRSALRAPLVIIPLML